MTGKAARRPFLRPRRLAAGIEPGMSRGPAAAKIGAIVEKKASPGVVGGGEGAAGSAVVVLAQRSEPRPG
jgi:hypothetical protein